VAWVAPFDTVFRGDVVRPGFTLEQYLDDMLADSTYALEARVGDENVALYQRIRSAAGEIGIPQLAALLREAPEHLEARLSFDRALQALLVHKHRDMNDNIRLANGFQPAMLQAPVYSFWADRTVDGARTSRHGTRTRMLASAARRLRCRDGMATILGANASAIADHLNGLLEDGHESTHVSVPAVAPLADNRHGRWFEQVAWPGQRWWRSSAKVVAEGKPVSTGLEFSACAW
jgi:hypothetical protein